METHPPGRPDDRVEIARHRRGKSYRGNLSQSATRRAGPGGPTMIRKLSSGEYRLYSRKKDPKTSTRRNLGTFKTRAAAERHERAVQYFKRAG
jgi:hypothetical protein